MDILKPTKLTNVIVLSNKELDSLRIILSSFNDSIHESTNPCWKPERKFIENFYRLLLDNTTKKADK